MRSVGPPPKVFRCRTLALFLAKAQQTEASRNAHQAKASHRINESLRFFTSPWSVGLRQISCIPCSKKKKETDVSDVSDLLACARD